MASNAELDPAKRGALFEAPQMAEREGTSLLPRLIFSPLCPWIMRRGERSPSRRHYLDLRWVKVEKP